MWLATQEDSPMPVTAKLSRNFYDRLGDDIANELVEWFNSVDATYKSDLREPNEINFARSDARLEQCLSELRADLRQEMAMLGSDLRQEMATLGSDLRREIAAQVSGVRHEMSRDRVTQMRWMIGLWAAQVTLFIGTVLTVMLSP
jgi:hypothetical protein